MAAAPADYSGNGNVTLLGRLDSQPPNPYYGDNTSTGTLYNGIWGYSVGSREYALQGNSFGLHIIDVTDPAAPFQVQFIDMSGGVLPPKGRVWRDVDIHQDPDLLQDLRVHRGTGGRQFLDRRSCPICREPRRMASTPIRFRRRASPIAAARTTGTPSSSTTACSFMNTANNGSTFGCQIFDLLQNAFDPPIIASWSGSGHDCHDSYARTNVSWAGGKTCCTWRTATRPVTASSTSPNVRTNGTTTMLGRDGTGLGHLFAQQLAERRLALPVCVRRVQRPRHRRLRRLQSRPARCR